MLRYNNSAATPSQEDAWSYLMPLVAVVGAICAYIGCRYIGCRYRKYKSDQDDVFSYKQPNIINPDEHIYCEIKDEHIDDSIAKNADISGTKCINNGQIFEAEIRNINFSTNNHPALQKCINNMQPNIIYSDINPDEHIYCEINLEEHIYEPIYDKNDIYTHL